MIKVIYVRDYHRVSIVGHAGSDEKGKDLICASASILAYTLAEYVKRVKGEDKVKFDLTSLEEGDAIISCSPYDEYKAEVEAVFDALCRGFEILAEDYPENISYEKK